MYVQKKCRLEFRLTKILKADIERFCCDNGIDVTFYLTTLIRSQLKRADYLTVVDDKKKHRWCGDVLDMPLDVDGKDKRWKRIA